MTVPRTVTLPSALVLAAGALASIGLGLATAACTNGTTPVCDDAGSCLILQNPSDAAPASQPDTGGGGGDSGSDSGSGGGGGGDDAGAE